MGTFEKHMRAVQSGRIDRANVIGIRNIPWQTAFAMGLESGPTIERNF